MSLSEKAQQEMSAIGILSRHTVVTWTGMIFALVLLVVALGLKRPSWAVPAFAALAVAMALMVAVKLPVDEKLMAANAARRHLSTQVFDELARGERGQEANVRRCRIFHRIDLDMARAFRERQAADDAFAYYWGMPFCERRAPVKK